MDNETVQTGSTQSQETIEVVKTEPTPVVNSEHEALKKLPVEDLINIISETRSEAKSRRLKAKELETKMAEIDNQNKLDKQAELEKNSEWEKLLTEYKEETKDYNDLKEFKQSVLERSKLEVEDNIKHLTDAEKDLFTLAAAKMTYDEQLAYLKKIVGNRQPTTVVDPTQSTVRTNIKDENNNKNKPVFMGSGNQNNALDRLKALRNNN